jgi:hypothetical protein
MQTSLTMNRQILNHNSDLNRNLADHFFIVERILPKIKILSIFNWYMKDLIVRFEFRYWISFNVYLFLFNSLYNFHFVEQLILFLGYFALFNFFYRSIWYSFCSKSFQFLNWCFNWISVGQLSIGDHLFNRCPYLSTNSFNLESYPLEKRVWFIFGSRNKEYFSQICLIVLFGALN